VRIQARQASTLVLSLHLADFASTGLDDLTVSSFHKLTVFLFILSTATTRSRPKTVTWFCRCH
jgi:hypothetical protein